jgi:hypothetical protein
MATSLAPRSAPLPPVALALDELGSTPAARPPAGEALTPAGTHTAASTPTSRQGRPRRRSGPSAATPQADRPPPARNACTLATGPHLERTPATAPTHAAVRTSPPGACAPSCQESLTPHATGCHAVHASAPPDGTCTHLHVPAPTIHPDRCTRRSTLLGRSHIKMMCPVGAPLRL